MSRAGTRKLFDSFANSSVEEYAVLITGLPSAIASATVNPNHSEVLGEKCYPDLASVPGTVDIVDCFRRPEDIPPVAREAVAKGAKVLWMQIGIRSEEGARIALAGGLDVVMNRCVKIEHARVMGGLHWAGVNTGVISARRTA